MSQAKFILKHLENTRRRSLMLWRSLPPSQFHWRPDPEAQSAAEMIRHVLTADHGWLQIIRGADMRGYQSPWADLAIESLDQELALAEEHRQAFLDQISHYSDQELSESQVYHPGVPEAKILGDYLLRTAYHESVHAGQFLTYLRLMEIPRPNIWD